MDTLFPEERDAITYGPDFRPLNDERLVMLNGKADITCILRFQGGRLHGERAVEASTSYTETWEHGAFVSASLGWSKRQPKRTVFPPADREGKLNAIRRAFENLGREDGFRFLGPLGDDPAPGTLAAPDGKDY